MKLLFTPEALSSFNELKTSNSREADKVKNMSQFSKIAMS